MGMIEDMMGLVRKGPELASELSSMKYNTKSVVRGANDATFQFPCLISDTIPIDMANTTVRTLDRVYADFTQTWISLHPFMDISLDPTPLSYMKRLHQNMKVESVELISKEEKEVDLVEEASRVYNGEANIFMNKAQDFGIIFEGADRPSRAMINSHKEFVKEYLSDFDLAPLVTYEAETDGSSASDLASAVINNAINQHDLDRQDNLLRQSDRGAAPKLTDRDVKKSNDILPYGIQVRLIAKNEKNQFVQYIDFIVGVKAIMHPIKSDDMIENIVRALQNKSLAFKFLRWTSGEISLFKDIILNLNDIKMDSANRSSGKSPWFSSLKRLKGRRIGLQNFTSPHALIPNATIALSSYEVDYMEQKYAVNLRDPRIAAKLVDTLFLVGFVIIDDGTGTIDIMYDGSTQFQTYALETLERENSMTSNKLGREIGRMISH